MASRVEMGNTSMAVAHTQAEMGIPDMASVVAGTSVAGDKQECRMVQAGKQVVAYTSPEVVAWQSVVSRLQVESIFRQVNMRQVETNGTGGGMTEDYAI
jgi:hypothetical protein